MLARRFLYVIAGLIVLVLIAGIGWSLFQDRLLRMTFVPDRPFDAAAAGPAPDYGLAAAWLSRPGMTDDPAGWTPPGESRPAARPLAVFYVAPTTFYGRTGWNASLDNADSRRWLRLFAASEASAFNRVGTIWAPRYRSAALGAFLDRGAASAAAIELAYGDVLRAFDIFMARVPRSQPIILAGHSQGSLHLMRLMQQRIAGRPVADRIVAAYLVGWPVSIEADIPALGLPACRAAGQPGCILSWQSFAEPAEPEMIRAMFDEAPGLTGLPRKGSNMLCVNPLTGSPGAAAAPAANLGALIPAADFNSMELKPGLIPARCDPSGFLLIGTPPKRFDGFVMPGNNYHVFDYAMFWANIRADAEARAGAYLNR